MDHPGFTVQHQSTAKPMPAATFGVLANWVEHFDGREWNDAHCSNGGLPTMNQLSQGEKLRTGRQLCVCRRYA